MAADRHPIHHAQSTVRRGEPLIGVLAPDNHGAEVVTYFTDEEGAGQAVTDTAVQAVLALAGTWAEREPTDHRRIALSGKWPYNKWVAGRA
jgi:hypothetical protein